MGMWTSCLGHSTACSAAAAAGCDCNRLADLPLPPLTAVAAESRLTPLTFYYFSVTTGTSAAARVSPHLLCSPSLARLHRRSNSHAYAAWLSSD